MQTKLASETSNMTSCGHDLSRDAAQPDFFLSGGHKAVPRVDAMYCFPQSFQIPHPVAISISLGAFRRCAS